jgi:hypothetical protein
MGNDDLHALMTDEFLDGLGDSEDSKVTDSSDVTRPEWVSENIEHTTFKAWDVILKLKAQRELSIKSFGKVADNKTPKGIYQIKKSEVAGIVGISSQSIFRASKFSDDVRTFFGDVNDELLELHEKEQKKQQSRSKNSGVRVKRKAELVDDVQSLREKVEELEARTVKETLDLLLKEMPIDLRRKLKM